MITILLSWLITLGGALVLRYSILKKPLPTAQAIGVALVLFIASAVLTLLHPQRQHAGMLLAVLLAYFVLRRGVSSKEALQKKMTVNEVAGDGSTPLMMAAMLGKIEDVATFVAAGAMINAVDERGWSALMHAAARNEPEVVQLLLTAGADPAMANHDGLTSLDLALKSGSLDASEILEKCKQR